MNGIRVRELLGRYMDGETTLDEERALREYFGTAHEVPDDIAYAREMFGYFGEAAAAKPEREFDIPAGMGAHTPRKRRSARRTRRVWTWTATAAAAAVIAAVAVFAPTDTGHDGEVVYCYVNGVPVTDYDVAYAYTRGALGLIETNIRKPGEYLAPVEKVGEALESLRYLGLLGLFADEE